MAPPDLSFPSGDGTEPVTLHWEERGAGFPLVLFAPGAMDSQIRFWRETSAGTGEAPPWIDPLAALSDEFRVIAFDQRNAGSSHGPIEPDHGWATYARDGLALLDGLGLRETHLMGGCIGSSYCLALCAAAPGRVRAAVLQNPIGLTATNRGDFEAMFDSWAEPLVERRAALDRDRVAALRAAMFGGDFVFSVGRDFVRALEVPLLVLAGHDQFHPTEVAEEIAALAPDATLVLEWAGPERAPATRELVRDFLRAQTPPG